MRYKHFKSISVDSREMPQGLLVSKFPGDIKLPGGRREPYLFQAF